MIQSFTSKPVFSYFGGLKYCATNHLKWLMLTPLHD